MQRGRTFVGGVSPLLALLLFLASWPATAAARSAWVQGPYSSLRLLPGSPLPGTTAWSAGLQIRLDRDFKTYWRSPGDSGVPPRFDWSRSRNVAAVTVDFPVPERFRDGDGYSAGYHGEVVFPLTVLATDTGAPVDLVLDLDYAVCGDICIPASASLTARLDPSGSTAIDAARLIAAYRARVPVTRGLGEPGAITVERVGWEPSGGRHRLTVDIAHPDGEAVDLFAEGVEGIDVDLPRAIAGPAPGIARFVAGFDLAAGRAGPRGAALRLTVTGAGSAVAIPLRLD